MDQIDLNNIRTGTKQVCISMSISDWMFIKKSGFSPSRLLRKAVSELKQNKTKENLDEMIMKADRMSKLIQQQAQMLEKMGLTEQFSKFQEEEELNELKAHRVEKQEEVIKKASAEADEILGIKND